MSQSPHDHSAKREEVDPEIPGIIFSLTKNEEEIVQSIAKTLAVEVPFFSLDDKIKISDDFQTGTEETQNIASNVELVVTANEIGNLSSKKDIKQDIDLSLERSENNVRASEPCCNSEEKKIIGPVQKKSSEYICNFCGKAFATASASETHEFDHTREKSHPCPSCSKSIHETEYECSQTSERNFICEVCKAKFSTEFALQSHVALHSRKKKFKCPQCRATFSDRQQLKVHMKKHEGKNYECVDCGDKFMTSHRLKRHGMIHTGERRFQCEECGVAFREDATLQTHMSVHLPRGPYPCDICGEVFPRLNSLALHKKVHNTNGAYKYIPWRKGGIYLSNYTDDKAAANDACPKKCVLEVSESKSGCLSIKTTTPNTENALDSLPSDPVAPAPSLQMLDMDSGFSNIRHPPSDAGKAVVADEKEINQVTNVPHPDVVRDALSTGMVLESQAEDGQVYFIVLPKALAEKDYTLLTFPPVPSSKTHMMTESVILEDSEELENNNCDLLMWDNDINAVTEVNFQPEQNLVSASTEVNKRKKIRHQKLSNLKESNVNELSNKRNQNATQKKDQKKEKRVKEKKLRTPRTFECPFCGKSFKTSSSFVIHTRSHTGERPYYCDYCGQGFKQMAHLRAHIRIHTGEAPFKCKMCDAAFKQSSRLKAHVKIHHTERKVKMKKVKKHCKPIRNFYCKLCDKTFLGSCYKIQHMKTHADERQHECETCGATFKTNLSLKRHWKVHDAELSGKCKMCGLKFTNLQALNFHMAKSHDVTLQNLEEDISGRRNFSDHVAKSVVSPNTDQSRQGSSKLNSHCGGKDTKNQNCNTPVLTRGKLPVYNCTECGKSFKKRTNLTVHMRMHTDERPYKCNNCCSAFRQISHLKDHAKVHTGEKPFKCSACLAAFCQSSAAKYHIKKKHKGKASVIKVEKNVQLKEEESISLENASDLLSETVIIQIENDVSSDGLCKVYNENKTVVKDENPEDSDGDNFSCTANIGRLKNKRKCTSKCKGCNKHGRKTRNSDGETLNTSKRCTELAAEQIDTESHSLFVELNKVEKKDVGNEEESNMNTKGENVNIEDDIAMESLTRIEIPRPKVSVSKNSLRSVTKTKSIVKAKADLYSNCGRIVGLEKTGGIQRQYEGSGNVCVLCGKTFGRASALKFHQQMSHSQDGDEQGYAD